MKKHILAFTTAALLASAPSLAKINVGPESDFDYSSITLGIGQYEVEGYDFANSISISASQAVSEHFYIKGSYESIQPDYTWIDSDSNYSILGGYKHNFDDTNFSLYTSVGLGFGSYTIDDDLVFLSDIGFKYAITYDLMVGSSMNFILSEESHEYIFDVSADYFFTNSFSLGLEYKMSDEISSSEDIAIFSSSYLGLNAKIKF